MRTIPASESDRNMTCLNGSLLHRGWRFLDRKCEWDLLMKLILSSILSITKKPQGLMMLKLNQLKIKSSLYSRYYAEACNEWWGPSPRLGTWATQLRRNVAMVASCWRHCADLTGPVIESQTSRTESVRLATELTAGYVETKFIKLAKTIISSKISNLYNVCITERVYSMSLKIAEVKPIY